MDGFFSDPQIGFIAAISFLLCNTNPPAKLAGGRR
jgi:hypothetical protein